MKIVQLSDLHLSESPLYGVVDTLAAFDGALQRVLSGPVPDLLLISGDLASDGNPREYQWLRDRLASLPFPIALLPGNHDHRLALREHFPDQAWSGHPYCCQRLDLGEGTLLLLDTVVAGKTWGEVDDARIDWLETHCPQRRPTLLVMHHPPFAVGIPGMDTIRCRNDDPLAAWLARHDTVEGITCGHVHRVVSTTYAGRPARTAPSPAHQIALQDGPLAYTLEPGGYLLHDWLPGERWLSHYVPSAPAAVHVYRAL